MKKISSALMIALSFSFIAASAQAQVTRGSQGGPGGGGVSRGNPPPVVRGGNQGGPGPSRGNPPPVVRGNPGYPQQPSYPYPSRPNPPPVVRGNPGYPQPGYPQPGYPRPGNYPNPGYPRSYPTYPSASIAPCVILSTYDGYSTTYQVYNSYSQLVLSTLSYSSALYEADRQENYRACYGVIFQSNNSQNYPNYPQSANYCQVMNGNDAYGNYLYRVLDRAGRVLVTTSDYSQAQYVSQSDARCFQYN